MKIFIILILMSTNVFAASILEQLIFELEYKYYLSNGEKNRLKFDANIECPKYVLQAQKFWDPKAKLFNGYMEEGRMEKAFTTNEILTMNNSNYHGVLGKIRGTDQILTGGYGNGSSPSFPHLKPGCEKYFDEDVKVIKLDNKNCRQITFTIPKTDINYKQLYCENDSKVYIDINPNRFNDQNAKNCRVGNDIVFCNEVTK